MGLARELLARVLGEARLCRHAEGADVALVRQWTERALKVSSCTVELRARRVRRARHALRRGVVSTLGDGLGVREGAVVGGRRRGLVDDTEAVHK